MTELIWSWCFLLCLSVCVLTRLCTRFFFILCSLWFHLYVFAELFFFFLLSKNIPFVTERLCDEWDPVFFLCFPMINRSRWPKRLWSPFSNNCDWRGCRERCASVCLYQTREEKKKKLGDSWMTLEKQQRRNWMANEVRRVIWQRGESKRLVSHWRAGWRKKEGVFRS